jgi:hypothetical protein
MGLVSVAVAMNSNCLINSKISLRFLKRTFVGLVAKRISSSMLVLANWAGVYSLAEVKFNFAAVF